MFRPASWLSKVMRRWNGKSPFVKRSRSCTLAVEMLEDRVVPSVTLPPLGPQSSAVGVTSNLYFMASNTTGNSVSYSATGLPAGLNAADSMGMGVISGTTTASAIGAYSVILTATDNVTTESDSKTFTWTVSANTPTLNLTNPNNQSSQAGNLIGLSLMISSSTGGPYTFTQTGLPDGLSVGTNYMGMPAISGTLQNSAVGTHTVSITASAGGASDTETFTWTVTANTPTVYFTGPNNQSSFVGNTASLYLMGSSSSGNTPTYTQTGLPSSLSITTNYMGSKVIAGTLTSSDVGVHNVTITATDGAVSVSQSFTWAVTMYSPTVTLFNPGGQTHYDGGKVSLRLMAWDSAGNSLAFDATNLPSGLFIDDNTGEIAGTIADGADVNSPYTVTVSATDSIGFSSNTQTFTWTVHSSPVMLTNPGNQQNVEGATVNLPLTAIDSLGNGLAFSVFGLPGGLTASSAGVISGTLQSGADDNGSYFVTVIVTDATANASATVTFSWTVSALNVPPTTADFGPITVRENGSATLNMNQVAIHASNLGSGQIRYAIVDQPQFGTLSEQGDGTLRYEPTPNYIGSDSFTYKLINSVGASNLATVSLSVIDAGLLGNDSYYNCASGAVYILAPDRLLASVNFTGYSAPILSSINGSPTLIDMPIPFTSGSSVTVLSDGSLKYQAGTTFVGEETFTISFSGPNSAVVVTVHFIVSQNPLPPRFGIPTATTTLAEVLRNNFPGWANTRIPFSTALGANWRNEPSISMTDVNPLMNSRTISVQQAAAVAILKGFVLQDPANLTRIGDYADVFGLQGQNVYRDDIRTFENALTFVSNPALQIRALQLETIFQDMVLKISLSAGPQADLFPNGMSDSDVVASIRQGSIGDCGLFSAVIGYVKARGIAVFRDRIAGAPARIQATGVLNGGPFGIGLYRVSLFDAAGQSVISNIEEPTYAEYGLYGGTRTGGGKWMAVLEKAYVAQWPRLPIELQIIQRPVTLYDVAATGEGVEQAIRRITGAAANQADPSRLRPNLVANLLNLVNPQQAQGGGQVTPGRVIVVGSKSDADIRRDAGVDFQNFPSQHAFSAVGFNAVLGRVRLRNPWNNPSIPNNWGTEFTFTLAEFLRLFNAISVQR